MHVKGGAEMAPSSNDKKSEKKVADAQKEINSPVAAAKQKKLAIAVIGIAILVLAVLGSYVFLMKVSEIQFQDFSDLIIFALIILGAKFIFGLAIYYSFALLKRNSKLKSGPLFLLRVIATIISTFLSIWIAAYFTPGIMIPTKGVIGLAIIIIIAEMVNTFLEKLDK